ncbi:hypothetical protein SF83666_c05840 [Sinorhizobium fredii CCBAU 83666]|nr:hypothetical protein SF83666_c05840 [Sinorhizobium fredii CCBAU 83666]
MYTYPPLRCAPAALHPPLPCRASPPQGGRLARSTAFRDIKVADAGTAGVIDLSGRCLVERNIAACRSPPMWGRCPAGQRGVSHERLTRKPPSRSPARYARKHCRCRAAHHHSRTAKPSNHPPQDVGYAAYRNRHLPLLHDASRRPRRSDYASRRQNRRRNQQLAPADENQGPSVDARAIRSYFAFGEHWHELSAGCQHEA